MQHTKTIIIKLYQHLKPLSDNNFKYSNAITIFQFVLNSTHIQLTILSPLPNTIKGQNQGPLVLFKAVFGTTNNRKQEFDFFDKNIQNIKKVRKY